MSKIQVDLVTRIHGVEWFQVGGNGPSFSVEEDGRIGFDCDIVAGKSHEVTVEVLKDRIRLYIEDCDSYSRNR